MPISAQNSEIKVKISEEHHDLDKCPELNQPYKISSALGDYGDVQITDREGGESEPNDILINKAVYQKKVIPNDHVKKIETTTATSKGQTKTSDES